MKLTGKDIEKIDEIMTEYGIEVGKGDFLVPWNSPQFYEEVARRFNSQSGPN